jgi:nucleotide-binding universal stress UspA family protein
VLIDESREAAAVVIGNRGRGGFAGLLLGSVTIQVATHADGPVVVVPPNEDPQAEEGRRVVVGVDGSDAADLAAGYAFEMAAQRGVELVAVRAWTPPKPPWRIDIRPLSLDVDEIATAELGLLRKSLVHWESMYPHVRVEPRLVAERAANALVSASEGAQLLVVGSRGLGGLRGKLLGSVSLRVLHHARCAVTVVHPDGAETGSDAGVAAVAGPR